MRKEICLAFLVVAIFLAGCVKQSAQQFKNDAVTIEDVRIPGRTLYSGGIASIGFYVKNNGDSVVNVGVDFFNIPGAKEGAKEGGFEVIDLKCDELGSKIGDKCVFENLEPFDSRSVSIDLKAGPVKVKTPYTVSFSVTYRTYGETCANIPIIDEKETEKPSRKYYESTSFDPIRLTFEKEIKPEEVEKEYWALTDKPFLMIFKFTHVGTVEGVEPINLPEGSMKLSLTNLKKEEPCDFGDNGTNLKPVKVFWESYLTCNFVPGPKEQGDGQICVNFDYDYKFISDETFTVYPR